MRAYKTMLAAALLSLPVAALADGGMKSACCGDETVYSHIIFSGGEISKDSWEGYTGTIIALNRDLSKDGVLVRMMGSYGRYDYDLGGTNYDGRMWQGDVMIGYQWIRDRVDIGFYVGVDHINHKISPVDATNPVSGSETGFKVAGDIETRTIELNLPHYFALEGSYSTAFDTYYALGRIGLHRSNVIFGLEGWLLGDETGDAQRVGGFVMWERKVRPDLLAEVTLSGGYQFVDNDGTLCGSFFGSEGGYANMNLAFKFGDHRARPLK
jgi:hypothetical protein